MSWGIIEAYNLQALGSPSFVSKTVIRTFAHRFCAFYYVFLHLEKSYSLLKKYQDLCAGTFPIFIVSVNTHIAVNGKSAAMRQGSSKHVKSGLNITMSIAADENQSQEESNHLLAISLCLPMLTGVLPHSQTQQISCFTLLTEWASLSPSTQEPRMSKYRRTCHRGYLSFKEHGKKKAQERNAECLRSFLPAFSSLHVF